MATSCTELTHWKDSDTGRDWKQEEKRMTKDEMAAWHHWLDAHEFEWTLGVGDGQGGLACCDSWGCKESDTTERLNWTEDPSRSAFPANPPPRFFDLIYSVYSCHLFFCVSLPLTSKSRKSRDTQSNRQIWPWSTEWSRAKANRVLQRECTGDSNHPLPTTQEKTLHMDITRWSTPKSDWLYSLQPEMKKLYTVSKNKTGSWLWLRSWTPYCQIQT